MRLVKKRCPRRVLVSLRARQRLTPRNDIKVPQDCESQRGSMKTISAICI